MSRPALLALEDGSVFEGVAFGYQSPAPFDYAVGEVVFNTAVTGYQEILTDPSYTEQLITLTCPHIGNVGVNSEDEESSKVYAKGLIIRQLSFSTSNWRAQESLDDFLKTHRVLGITQIDTRRLTRLIREQGALRGCILSAPFIKKAHQEQALQYARAFSGLQGKDLAKAVTTDASYFFHQNKQHPFIVAYDFGIKKTILRCLKALPAQVLVVPAQTPAQEVLALQPQGIFLSNGPGDPAACDYAITAIQHFLAHKIPLFGICLGHQLLALACGAKTEKMKLGHHGANHPVRDLAQNRVLITSQNHGFTVSDEDFPASLKVTHRSLFDNTVQGIMHRTAPAMGFQGHPEAGPGPLDARYLFSHFMQMMKATMLPSSEKNRVPSVMEID